MPHKLGLAAMVSVGLISFCLGVGSLAIFNATARQQETKVVTGRVTLGEPAVTEVNASSLVPGQSGSSIYEVEYTGNADAWLVLSTKVDGPLLRCDGGGRLYVRIRDQDTGQPFDLNADRQVIGSTPRAPGSRTAIITTWALDSGTMNDCQDKTASISIQLRALQSDLNTDPVRGGPLNW